MRNNPSHSLALLPNSDVHLISYFAISHILHNTDGLVHVSQLADDFVKNIDEVVKVGDQVG